MSKFFREIKTKRFLKLAYDRVQLFERNLDIDFPDDYRKFLISLEAYSEFKKSAADSSNLSKIEIHLDTLFDNWYFTLPNIPGEFDITAIANLNLLEDLNVTNYKEHKEFFIIGTVWNMKSSHYFLSLKISGIGRGEVYLCPENNTSNSDDLIQVSKSFKIFIEEML